MGFRAPTVTGALLLAVLAISSYTTYFLIDEQVAATAAADTERVRTITDGLFRHGVISGDWAGSDDVIKRLSLITGERVRLTTAGLAVDSDQLTGRRVRPVGDPTTTVDPRPRLALDGVSPGQALATTMLEIRQFRRDATHAACLTKAGIPVDVRPGPHGVPRLDAAPSALRSEVAGVAAQCPMRTLTADNFVADNRAILECPRGDDTTATVVAQCLRDVFTARTEPVTAQPAAVFIGTRRDGIMVPFTLPLIVSGSVQAIALLTLAWRMRPARRRAAQALVATGPRPTSDASVGQLADALQQHQELKQQQEQQRQVVARVAHELRAPLTNLRAYLEGLSEGVVEPDPQLFASLHQEALLQQRIIDDLKKGTPGGYTLTYEPVELDLALLVQSCRVPYLAVTDAAGLRLTVVTGRPLPVRGDPGRLRQVFANLLTNAVRYTLPGGTVEMRTWRDGTEIYAQVRDTGIGIGADDLPRVFDRHWRADAACQRVPAGTGMGLALAREIIDAHGGRISLDSRLGIGTTVTVVLPLSPTAPPPATARTHRSEHSASRRHRSSR